MTIKKPTDVSNEHNHVTRDIKPIGQCPACDRYHDKHIPRGEKIGERSSFPMTEIDRAFGEWLKQGGYNGTYNLRTAFEAGVKFGLSNKSDEKCYQAIKQVTETEGEEK